MDIYLLSLILGSVGLGAMAVGGLGRHGGHGGSHGSHSGGHGLGGHGGGHGAGHGHGAHGTAGGHGQGGGSGPGGLGQAATTWMLMSPRFLFAGLFGFGLVGMAFKTWLGGGVLLAIAIAGGILIERLLVAPLWNLSMRFASNPALTFGSAITGEATAVSNFDKNGQGIVAIEVDGQVQQVLATLTAADRAAGAKVRAGQLVRIDDVDTARHRCTVTLL